MGLLISPELSLDEITSVPEKISKISDCANRLRDEMKKIDAFKRELPLCMMLLNDAILVMNEELTRCQREPVLEQFIPLKDTEIECDEKRSWMSSVQLWSNNEPPTTLSQFNKKKRTTNTNDLLWSWKNTSGGRAFAPFANMAEKELVGVPGAGLSLEIKKSIGFTSKSSCQFMKSPAFVVNGKQKSKNAQKQRRRWSPELHRRFLFALHKLGGSKVATPKQIRELMQVENLTNDEVKSHLQKYRLHNRRIHLSSNVPLEGQFGESSKQSNWSGSPHGPLNIFGSSSGTSLTEEDSTEDEDEDDKLESHCWKNQLQLSLKR